MHTIFVAQTLGTVGRDKEQQCGEPQLFCGSSGSMEWLAEKLPT